MGPPLSLPQWVINPKKAAGDATEALEAQLSELKASVATKDDKIAAAASAAEEGKTALESAQQELAAANDKVTALEAQLEEAKNVSLYLMFMRIEGLLVGIKK